MFISTLSEYINANAPMSNIPALLGLHHGNPLGLHPIAIPILLLVLAVAMRIMYRYISKTDRRSLYPLLYGLWWFAVAATYYYCFSGDLPLYTDEDLGRQEVCVGWFCQRQVVGDDAAGARARLGVLAEIRLELRVGIAVIHRNDVIDKIRIKPGNPILTDRCDARRIFAEHRDRKPTRARNLPPRFRDKLRNRRGQPLGLHAALVPAHEIEMDAVNGVARLHFAYRREHVGADRRI